MRKGGGWVCYKKGRENVREKEQLLELKDKYSSKKGKKVWLKAGEDVFQVCSQEMIGLI